jgi:sulfur relay (sulfurtransferase) DsrC/TusE family protein
MICNRIKTSKQNLVKARECLKQRGFISFVPGKGKEVAPTYTIMEHISPLSVEMSVKMSEQLSVELSEQLSPYNIKDKDNNKDNSINNARENESSLDELELRLSNDTSWQESIISLLSSSQQIKLSHIEIENYINQFFQYLKISGIERREEKEVRTYFFNWLKKTILNNKKNVHKQQETTIQRRSTDVPVASPTDYQGTF